MKVQCLLVLFGVLFGSGCVSQRTGTIQPKAKTWWRLGGYELVWADEFDGAQLDQEKWQIRYPGKYRASMITMDSVSVADGLLTFTTRAKGEEDVECGMISTTKTFTPTYGYFETRIRFNQLRGNHGCFWLQSPTYGKIIDDPGKSGVEVDIIEYFGASREKCSQNIYWNGYRNEHMQKRIFEVVDSKYVDQKGNSLADEFHVYGFEWTPKGYRFFIDGKETFRVKDGVSHRSQYMILSLFRSEWEVPLLKLDELPDTMIVDYVRVFQKK